MSGVTLSSIRSVSGTANQILEPVEDVYLGRQPIIDENGALAGYELLFRKDYSGACGVFHADSATAHVIQNTLGAFWTSDLLNGCPGYLNVGTNFLMSNALEVLPPEHFVIEILEDVQFDKPVIERCRALRAAGYRLALDDVSPSRRVPDAMLPEIDIAKIDLIATPITLLRETIERFRHAGVAVLAEKVETRAAFEHTKALGCSLFQGYFFARPEVLRKRMAHGAGGPLIRLMRLLNAEPQLGDLEAALKATPAVVVQLLRLADAAASGTRGPVATLREAIGRVGTDRLMRWIQLLLFAQGNDMPLRFNPLVQLVGTRARFMELAARRLVACHVGDSALPSQAYLVGMLSLAYVALQTSIESLQHELGLAPVISCAIQSHDGDLGCLLLCAQAVETQDEDMLAACARRWPMLDRGTMAALALEAAVWATQQAR